MQIKGEEKNILTEIVQGIVIKMIQDPREEVQIPKVKVGYKVEEEVHTKETLI